MAWKDYRKEHERERRANRSPEQVEKDRLANNIRARRYYRRHREEILANDKTPERRARRNAAARTYAKKHLRPADYELKLASQNNLCALCGKPFDFSSHGTKPCYDHNHKTGQ